MAIKWKAMRIIVDVLWMWKIIIKYGTFLEHESDLSGQGGGKRWGLELKSRIYSPSLSGVPGAYYEWWYYIQTPTTSSLIDPNPGTINQLFPNFARRNQSKGKVWFFGVFGTNWSWRRFRGIVSFRHGNDGIIRWIDLI